MAPSPPQISTSDTTQPALEPAVPHKIHYLEEGVQQDANYRVQWSNWMSDGQKKSFYKHVFVLLMSWHPECDDMNVEKEVRDLESVLKDTYNYDVESVLIDSRLKVLTQAQANLAMAHFVAKNDQEDALFIIYYAGHGSPGKAPGYLNMSGRRRDENQKGAQQFSTFTWNHVESNLKTTQAHVLLIFDCCHASDLGRDSILTSRSFEYLAATTSNYTRSPGEQSFTRALIWALEKLASSRQASPMFTTTKLAKTICEAPKFPPDQKPSLTTRDIDSWKRIILAPLPREGVSEPNAEDEGESEDEDEKPTPQCLSLTFQFKSKQSSPELKNLADHLKTFMRTESTSLHRIEWSGIWDETWRPPPRYRFREVVSRVMATHSPTSRLKNSTFPSSHKKSDGLYPPNGNDSSELLTAHTPLLSGASSFTLEDGVLVDEGGEEQVEEEATTRGIWSRISSFFRSLWETSKKWTSCLKDKPRIFSRRSPPRFLVSHSR